MGFTTVEIEAAETGAVTAAFKADKILQYISGPAENTDDFKKFTLYPGDNTLSNIALAYAVIALEEQVASLKMHLVKVLESL